MKKKKEKVVVFGGSGFLGSHIADVLSAENYEVVIYDKKESCFINTSQKMVVGDVLDEDKVHKTIKGAKYAYNLCGISDIAECAEKPLESIKCNVLGHAIILEQCRILQVQRIIFASSIYVYGNHGSFYRITKQTSEQLLEEYNQKFGVNYTILRYGSIYGSRAQAWNGMYRYVSQAIKESQIDYPGTGEERREYIHVLDAAKLSVNILNGDYKNECLIISGYTVLKSKDLLKMITEILDKDIKINFTKINKLHHYAITPHNFNPKFGKKILANPSIDMAQGLLDMIAEIYKEDHPEEYKTHG